MGRILRLSGAAVLAVLVSTALVCLIALTNAAITTSLQDAVRRAVAKASVVVTPSSARVPLSEAALQEVQTTLGVDIVTGQVLGVVTSSDLGGATLAAQSITDAGQFVVGQGRLPRGPAEAVLAPVLSKPVHAGVGSVITLLGEGGSSHRVTVVGLVEAPSGVIQNTALPTVIGTVPAALQWTGNAGYNRLLVQTRRDPAAVAEAVRRLPHVAGHATVQLQENYVQQHVSDYAAGARTVLLALRLLGLVTLVAAFAVITNTFTIRTVQRTRQLALLRCLGASRRQVFGMMLAEALVTGFAGGLGGLLLGHTVAAAALGALPAGLQLHLTWSATAVALTLAAGLVSAVLAVLRPALQAARIAPIEALRESETALGRPVGRVRTAAGMVVVLLGLGLIAAGAALHEVILAVAGAVLGLLGMAVAAPTVFTVLTSGLAALAGAGGRNVARNLRRNPRRMGATAVSIWFGITLITAVLVGAATAATTLNRTIDEGTPTDVIVATRDDPRAIAARVAALPQVSASVLVDSVMVEATVASRQQLMTLVAWTPDLSRALRNGRVPEPVRGTIALPKSFGLAEGEDLRLNQRDTAVALHVVTVDGAPGVGIVNHLDYARFTTRGPEVWVKLTRGTDQQQALAAIGNVAGGGANLSSPSLKRSEINRTLQQATQLATVLLAVTVVIALIGIANTLSLAVVERTREIGLLRALGALRRQVIVMVLLEALVTSTAASVLGLGFGVAYGLGGVAALLGGEQLAVTPMVPWLPVAGVLLANLPCALLAALLPARSAASIPPIAALSTTAD